HEGDRLIRMSRRQPPANYRYCDIRPRSPRRRRCGERNCRKNTEYRHCPDPAVTCRRSTREIDFMVSHLEQLQRFTISFDLRDKKRVFEYWNEIFSNQKWTEGKFTALFEEKWSEWNGLPSVATSSWAGGAMACMEYFKLSGKKVLCPTNTFMATPLSILKANAQVEFADSNREDLCLSYDAVVSAAAKRELAAVWLVHVGGHIAFDTPRIAEFCRSKGIILVEDCAHAHGASWRG